MQKFIWRLAYLLAMILTALLLVRLFPRKNGSVIEHFQEKFQGRLSLNNSSHDDTDPKHFFVITTIFNPASYKSRYNLYHKFAQHLNKTGAQLITIECIFPSLNQTKFQVTDSRNPFHIQLKSESVYWMKENLINIAVSRIPPHAKWVCWLDADILFDKKNWVELTIKALKKYSVVQIFERAKYLGPPPVNKISKTDYSFGYSVVHGKIIDEAKYSEWFPHPGFGWAMSVSTFRAIGGLPDYFILGSGDYNFAFSLIEKICEDVTKLANPEFKTFLIKDAQENFKILKQISKDESKFIFGYVPVNVTHLWHGSQKDRRYVERWSLLIAHDFNYHRDIRKTDNGLLQLTPTKPLFQKDIIAYFQMRHEDKNIINSVDKFITRQQKRQRKL